MAERQLQTNCLRGTTAQNKHILYITTGLRTAAETTSRLGLSSQALKSSRGLDVGPAFALAPPFKAVAGASKALERFFSFQATLRKRLFHLGGSTRTPFAFLSPFFAHGSRLAAGETSLPNLFRV